MKKLFNKYLSYYKIINFLKLKTSYVLSIIVSKPIHWGKPSFLAIEPINNCNLECPECPTGNGSMLRTKSQIEMKLHNKIIDETGKFLWSILYYFQGEPFLNPNLFEMIRYASDNHIYTITSTNGHFLNIGNSEKIIKSGLDKLIISLDGITPESYQIYRKNGSFNKVLEGIKTIVGAKKQLKSKSPIIIIQFLVFKSNQHQIKEAKALAKKLNVDRIDFKTAQIYAFKNGNPQIPDISKYSRYKQNIDGTYTIKSKLRNRCWRMWANPVLTVSGDISVCCFDKNAEFKVGNLNKSSLFSIWKSEEYDNFRKTIFKSRKGIEMCTNCTEGLPKVFS
jgi:radical SAM protein with 4Fe4S-binding SPASM domain